MGQVTKRFRGPKVNSFGPSHETPIFPTFLFLLQSKERKLRITPNFI